MFKKKNGEWSLYKNGKKVDSGSLKKVMITDASMKSKKKKRDDDESADIPANVTGSY